MGSSKLLLSTAISLGKLDQLSEDNNPIQQDLYNLLNRSFKCKLDPNNQACFMNFTFGTVFGRVTYTGAQLFNCT
jgi:hypothetical protein